MFDSLLFPGHCPSHHLSRSSLESKVGGQGSRGQIVQYKSIRQAGIWAVNPDESISDRIVFFERKVRTTYSRSLPISTINCALVAPDNLSRIFTSASKICPLRPGISEGNSHKILSRGSDSIVIIFTVGEDDAGSVDVVEIGRLKALHARLVGGIKEMAIQLVLAIHPDDETSSCVASFF